METCSCGEDWVKPSATEEAIRADETHYAGLGFPGAIGSLDCTHLRWDRCPAGIQLTICCTQMLTTAVLRRR